MARLTVDMNVLPISAITILLFFSANTVPLNPKPRAEFQSPLASSNSQLKREHRDIENSVDFQSHKPANWSQLKKRNFGNWPKLEWKNYSIFDRLDEIMGSIERDLEELMNDTKRFAEFLKNRKTSAHFDDSSSFSNSESASDFEEELIAGAAPDFKV